MHMSLPNGSMACIIIVMIAGIAVPVALLLVLRKVTGGSYKAFFWGCFIMFLFAMTLESIIHQFVYSTDFGQKIWNNAADVIVPLVRKAQSRNGIKSYTPGEYADRGAGTKEVSPSPEASVGSTGEGTQQAPRTPQESADPAGDGTKDAPQTPAESADSPSDGTEGQEP